MAVKVLGSVQSTCTQRVLTVLHELGKPFELVDIDMSKGQHKDPTYIRDHHPFGVIPVLYDGPIKLFESRAICRYLVEKYGKPGPNHLLPNAQDDLPALGLFEQALSVEYSYFDPAMKTMSYELIFKGFMGHGEPDTKKVEHTVGNLRKTLDYYEELLQNQSYLAGNTYTLIDLFHIPWFSFLPRLNLMVELESRPKLAEWWGQVSSRPAWRSALQA